MASRCVPYGRLPHTSRNGESAVALTWSYPTLRLCGSFLSLRLPYTQLIVFLRSQLLDIVE